MNKLSGRQNDRDNKRIELNTNNNQLMENPVNLATELNVFFVFFLIKSVKQPSCMFNAPDCEHLLVNSAHPVFYHR